MDEKFIVKTKKFNTWIRSELRFLPEGISIVNEYKSILIKYNELTGLNLDDDETQIRALTFDEINVILNSVG